MRINDPTQNPILAATTCYLTPFEYIALGIAAVGAIAGATTSIISGQQQASAQNAMAQAQAQQAENARAIAQYNADIQRQNNDVAYQMALYQASYGQQMAQVNQAMALRNAEMANLQAVGAQRGYEQGIESAKQKEIEAAATRAQANEEANRQREENLRNMASVRSKYGASGVSFEGSPLVVLADTARLGESVAQDIHYAGELESRKELREAEIEKFNASFSLIDKYGFEVEAANLQTQAQMFGYESDLYEYDSAIAGVRHNIGLKEAQLVELGGAEKAFSYEVGAQQSSMAASASMFTGYSGAVTSLIGGASSAVNSYGMSRYGYKGAG